MAYDELAPIGCHFCHEDFACHGDLWQHFLAKHKDKHDLVMRPTQDSASPQPAAVYTDHCLKCGVHLLEREERGGLCDKCRGIPSTDSTSITAPAEPQPTAPKCPPGPTYEPDPNAEKMTGRRSASKPQPAHLEPIPHDKLQDMLGRAAEQSQPEGAREYPWTLETMRLINELTPQITGKAFDTDWFLLRQRFEQFEYDAASRLRALREAAQEVIDSAVTDADTCSICLADINTHVAGCSIDALARALQGQEEKP